MNGLTRQQQKAIFSKYNSMTNMSYNELKNWKNNSCSKKASLSAEPLNRNIRLKSKNYVDWTAKDFKDANRTISFNSRMLGVRSGESVSKRCNLSKRDISLKNWGYDVSK